MPEMEALALETDPAASHCPHAVCGPVSKSGDGVAPRAKFRISGHSAKISGGPSQEPHHPSKSRPTMLT